MTGVQTCALPICTTIFIPVQKYKSQSKIKVAVKKKKEKNGTKNITTIQQYVSQYKKNVSVQKNIFSKIWKKSVGTLYMIITMYLNIYAYYSVPKQTLYTSLL